MDQDRFDFLTHEQFERLSRKEKFAYLERATAELDRLRRVHMGAFEQPEANEKPPDQ